MLLGDLQLIRCLVAYNSPLESGDHNCFAKINKNTNKETMLFLTVAADVEPIQAGIDE